METSEREGAESALRVGDLYWKKENNDSKDWTLVKVSKFDDDSLTGTCILIDEKTGNRLPNQTEPVDMKTMMLCPANPLFVTYADMTSLRYLHEAALVKNLYDRWIHADRQPYTSMSNVLIAVNPLRYLKKLEKKMFVTQSLDKSPPHPYNVAENAYRQLRTVKQNQSIIISGESGSGKTETSKIILDFLTERSSFTGGHPASFKSNQEDVTKEQEHALGERLMETIPILESFGNAKTHRNHNSSRFGKYMRLQFSPDEDVTSTALHLTGASIDTYLLETSRVVHPPEGERNFHVFYEVLRSGDAKLLQDLKLVPNPYMKKSPKATDIDSWMEQYYYLNRSGCTQSDFIDDRKNFQNLKAALNFAGINPMELFRIVAGVLHLGNLDFDEEDTPEGMTAIIHREDAPEASIDIIADMLGIKTEDLIDALLKKKIERTKGNFQRRGSVYFVGKTVQQALYSRDTVAKMIYDQVFTSLMVQCADILEYNTAMKDELPYIGVLDIFGFEDFEPKNRNSFEQLLINYANESLQSMFNQCILKAEQELYQAENIWAPQNASLLFPFAPITSEQTEEPVNRNNSDSSKPISYDDNRECLSLIADRRDGILAILNTVGRLAGPSDRKLNERLHSTFKKHVCFILPHPREAQHTFCIKHYAGVVKYRIDGFIDKNNNVASSQFKELISGSTLTLLNSSSLDATSKTPPGSVSEMFSHQMKGLILELDSTRNNFIRCIKPNPAMDVNVFDRRSVLDQLRCSGTIQACQVLQVGLPTRVSYEELVFIYSDMLGASFMTRFNENERLFTQALCKVLDFPTDAFRLGDTRLFFKTGKIHLLDTVLAVTPTYSPTELKSRLVSYLARYRWITSTTKVVILRACEQLFLNCRQGRRAIVLQCWFRQILARKRVQKMRAEKRVANQLSVMVKKMNVRAAFDNSVEDKLALLNVLLRHKVLPSNAKWLLTWLGPLQRAMYVRKLGRAACIAYLAKRAFSSLLTKVREERACIKIQSQFRRILALKRMKALQQKHKAQLRWGLIRIVTKVNICFMGMYRRAHLANMERDVLQLRVANEVLTSENQLLNEKLQTIQLSNSKEEEYLAKIQSLEDAISAKNDEILSVSNEFENLQRQVAESQALQEQLKNKLISSEQQKTDLTSVKVTLDAQIAELNVLLSQSKQQNQSLVAEGNRQVESFAEQIDAFQNKLNDMKHEMKMKTVQISELEEYNAELKEENENLASKMDDAEQAHEKAMTKQIQQSMAEVSTLVQQLEVLESKVQAMNQTIERLTMSEIDYEAKLKNQQDEYLSLTAELESVRVEYSTIQTELESTVMSSNVTINQLSAEVKSLQNELEKANSVIELKSSQIMEIEEIKEQYKEKGNVLMDKMVELERTLKASKEEELGLALAALQAKSDQQVATLTSQLKTLQIQLKQSSAEIQIQNAAIQEFEKFKETLRADNAVLKNKIKDLSSTLAESKANELALDNSLTRSQEDKAILQAKLHMNNLVLKETSAELERTKQSLAAKTLLVEDLERVREQLTQVHKSLTVELNSLKLSQETAKQVEAQMDSQLAESTQRVIDLGSQLKQMQLQLDQVNEHMAVTDAVVLAEEAMKNQLKLENDVLAEKVDMTSKTIAEVRDKEIELASQVSLSNMEISSLLSRIESLQQNLDDANQQIDAQSKQLKEFSSANTELSQKNVALMSKVADLECTVIESNTKETELERKIERTTSSISELTKKLESAQEQFSQTNEEREMTASAKEDFEALMNKLNESNMTFSEKIAELVAIISDLKSKEQTLNSKLNDRNNVITQMESQTLAINQELNDTEVQLQATLANALELKSVNNRLENEIASIKEQLLSIQKSVEEYQQNELRLNSNLDEATREKELLQEQVAKLVAELEAVRHEVTAQTSLVVASDAINNNLMEELATTAHDLELAEAKILEMKAIEKELGDRIADSNDHIYALQTQLTQIISKFDYESDHTTDVKVVPSTEFMEVSKSSPIEPTRITENVQPRSDIQAQIKSATPVISNEQLALTNTSNLLPSVQAVFISVPPENEMVYAQNTRQELEARIDGNNNKVAALEAQVRLLEMKQEHFLQEARANESIEKLKANIAEKDNLIVRLQTQIRQYEIQLSDDLSFHGGLNDVIVPRAPHSSPAQLSSDVVTLTCNNPAAQLVEQVKQQQDLMRRVRKVVLQSRWTKTANSSDNAEPEEAPEPDQLLISRAFSSFDPTTSFED